MIFVTVGISQPFDRLIKEIDRISGLIPHSIYAQIGRTYYEPINIPFDRFLSEKGFSNYIKKADIVIAHGGFGSIYSALSQNKPLISVPKNYEFDETDNDQTDLVKFLEAKGKLKGVYDIVNLERTISNFSLTPENFCDNIKISQDIDGHIKKWLKVS